MESGDIAGAYTGFQSISDYADSAEIAAKIESDYQAAQALLEQKPAELKKDAGKKK